MSKVIDYDKIVRDSFLKAQRDLGLMQEATVEIPQIQTKKWGSKAFKEYEGFEKLLIPLRRAVNATGVVKPEQFKDVISKLNQILGIKEEKILGFKTDVVSTDETDTGVKAALPEILSAVVFYRTLVSILREQDPSVAGTAFENFIAVLFSGVTSGPHKPTEDVIAGDSYISVKAITSRGDVEGSVNNLARSLAETPDKKITYLVAVKDQTRGATKIDFYSFEVNKDNFFQFIKPLLDKAGVKQLFEPDTNKPTKEFLNYLNTIYKTDDYLNILSESKNIKKELLQEFRFLDLLSIADINEKFSELFLQGIFPQEKEYIEFFLASESEKTALLASNTNLANKDYQKKYLKAIQEARKKLLEQLKEDLSIISNETFTSLYELAKSKGTLNQAELEIFKDKKSFEEYLNKSIPDPEGANKSLFNVSKAIQIQKLQNEIEKNLSIEEYGDKINIVKQYDSRIDKTKEEQDFKNKILELAKTYPQLQQLANYTFAQLYASEPLGVGSFEEKTKIGDPKSKVSNITLLDVLNEEFEKRLKKYREVFLQDKKLFLKPIYPITNFIIKFSKELVKIKADIKTQDIKNQFTGDKAKFLDALFVGSGRIPAIFANAPRRAEKDAKNVNIKYTLKTIVELGIPLNQDYETIFLTEEVLENKSNVNVKSFNEFIEPFNRNSAVMKEGWDKYIFEDDVAGLSNVQNALIDLKKHLRKFAISPVESETAEAEIKNFKKASELTEVLNMTKEAAIVLEMLQRMED